MAIFYTNVVILMEIYEGKAKKMIPLDDGKVIMEFKDDATAFNGEKKHNLRAKAGLTLK